MDYVNEKIIDCDQFEEHLTEYLDKSLDGELRKGVAAHALSCTSCHGLLNEIKEAMEVCRQIAVPKARLTGLEARILSVTAPDSSMGCQIFEDHLTDYLDGFLPAAIFHRWERHAVICDTCTDLPGEVVRSIAACYTYKSEELPVPEGLHQRILQATIGTQNAKALVPTRSQQLGEWIRSWKLPISIPQFAPVAMMVLLAFFVFSQTVSADGSISGMYQKSVELAEQTYEQSSGIWRAGDAAPNTDQKTIDESTMSEGK